MKFENVKIVDPYVDKGWSPEIKLTLATSDEVNILEAKLKVSLPIGYKEYVTTLGLGAYCNYIRIEMPSALLTGYQKYQRFLDEYWFWELGKEVIAKEKAIQSIKLGDTIDGDVIIFHPSSASKIFVLPRHDDMSHCIGSDLYEAIDWLCVSRHNPYSGSVGETHEQRYFVPENPFVHTHGWLWPDSI